MLPRIVFAPLLIGYLVIAGAIHIGCERRSGATSPRPVTVMLVGLDLDTSQQLRRDALDEFTRTTGIDVDPIPTAGTSTDQLGMACRLFKQHASSPDVYVIDAIWPGTLADDLLDLTPYLDSEARSHWPALLDNSTVRGRIVALPFYLNVGMLYYRDDLLKKYGYRLPPRTWEELQTMAAGIQRGERAGGNPNFWGYVWQGGSYEGLTCNALEWQFSFGGGRVIEADGSISVDNPRAAQAFRMATGWIGAISPPSVLSYNEADSLNAFRSGNAAFLRYWGGGFSSRFDRAPARFGVTALPAGPRGRAQSIGGFELGVSRYSAHPREAARLVMFLTGREVQLRRAVRLGYLPTIPALYETPQISKALPQLAALKEGTWVARPSSVAGAKYADISRAYYHSVHDILSGNTRAEAALAALEQRLTALTGFPAVAAAPRR